MRRRTAWVWVIAVLTAALAWSAPAGAAQVDGALVVTEMTATNVSILFTGHRTCTGGEQCDYFTEIDQLEDDSLCPPQHPEGPWWILWTGKVQNTGPSSETGTATPRGWSGPTPAGRTRLCMYMYADFNYYLVDSAMIAPAPTPAAPGPGGPGSTPGNADGRPRQLGKPSPDTVTCRRYVYQQSAQNALKSDPALAARLDRNGNGVACESLPKHKHYATTVGVRAAATATRAALRKTYGAAFTHGTRYRARCARISRTRVRCSVSWRHLGTWTGTVDVISRIRDNKREVVARPNVLRPV